MSACSFVTHFVEIAGDLLNLILRREFKTNIRELIDRKTDNGKCSTHVRY